MGSPVRTVVPVLYVQSLAGVTGFYELLGFTAVATGHDTEWSWWFGRSGEAGLLIAQDGRLQEHRGPVQLYFLTDDVADLHERLRAAGVAVEHLGYPDHAPGGEIRTVDPEGRVVMVAQTVGSPASAAAAAAAAAAGEHREPHERTSVLQQAAEALRRRGESGHDCQVPGIEGARCRESAEVKIADTWGDTVWACLPHADEVLFTVPSAYLATEDAEGLHAFLTRRSRAGT